MNSENLLLSGRVSTFKIVFDHIFDINHTQTRPSFINTHNHCRSVRSKRKRSEKRKIEMKEDTFVDDRQTDSTEMRDYTVHTLFLRVPSTSLSLFLSFFITKTYIKSTSLRNNFKSFTLTHFLSLSFFDSVPQFVCLSFFRSPCLSICLSFILPV